MGQTLNLKIAGLWTDPNQFGDAVPQGALNIADEIVITRGDVADSRRGQAQYGEVNNTPNKFFQFEDHLLAHIGNAMALDSNQAGTFTYYSGTFDPPDSSVKIRSFEGNQNFYITSSTGIRKLATISGSFSTAGGIKALYGTSGTLTNPGFMSNNTQVAYRIVWGIVDANDNEIVGVPSQRLVVPNSSGATADVPLTWKIPSGITTSHFYRVYRSGESASSTAVPDDELQQVKEGSPTSSEISAGELSFTDIVPNDLRGAKLYTDPSQEGILQANEPPPFALDIAFFRDCAFYFNTRAKQRYFINLVAVGDNTLGGFFGYQTNNGTTHTNTTIDGLTKAATIVIQDLTYTADTAGVAGNDISVTYTGGGTAGAEVVSVSGSSISVQIQSAVSTATQIKTAVDASGAAAALVNVTVSGSGAAAQTTQAQTFLADGFDTTYLNVGMRVVGTGVQAGTTIVSIDSISAITVTPATTASATVAMVFQDRFSIDSMNYWAASTADYPNRQFIAVLSGSPASNIQSTALNLIAAINSDPNNTTVYAYYVSGAEDLPGMILIEERTIGGAEFALTSTNGESFSPVLSTTGVSNVSDNDAHQNRAMFSKIQQPEAVPLVNFLPVGSENFPITRAVALRDSIFVFKPGEGIWRITGTDSSTFTVSLFDSSAQIRAPETSVVLNNQVFTFSDQGIIAVSENGVQIISKPIENTLLQLSSPQFVNFETASFGVAYESDRQYIFFTMSDELDEFPTQAFVFSTLENAFTRWEMTRSCGLVLKSDNKLYMGNPDDLFVYQERKNFDRSDYADNQFDVTIVSSDEMEVVLTDTSDCSEGDLLKQGGTEAIITEVVDSTTLTVSVDQIWSAGAAIVYEGIDTSVEWVPNSAANPGLLKHYSECTVLFKDAAFRSIDVGFQNNLSDDFQEIELPTPAGQGWGEFPWGERPWDAPGGKPASLRTYVPLEQARGSWLNFRVSNREAYSSFSLAGISAEYEEMSSRQR